MGVAGAPGSVSPSGVVSRISPALIPSVVSVQKADYDRFEGGNRPYFTSSYGEEQTPMSSTEVQIIDNGNASCRFVRSTVYQYPASEELAEACKLPTALTFQPFARQVSSEPPVPLVSYGTEVHPKTGKSTSRGPLRCNRCRGYLNPRVVFEKGGRGWRCNLCSFLNDVPDWFFCDLDATGRRLDHSTRPELQFGTCDFEASPEYILRQGCLPAHLIIGIDCSRASVQNGAFEAFLRSAKALLQNHDVVALYARVALFLFDRNVTFVQAGSDKREDASLVVLPDISEPFMPSPGNGDLGIFFNPLDHSARESVLKALSHSIPATFLETRVVDCCFGAAAALPLEALKSCGGRVVLMCASMANFGPGALKNREAIAAGSQQQQLERVHPLLNPQGDYYTKIAASASRLAISYGLVLCPATYVDSSTLVELTSSTSGFLLMYPKARVGLPAQSAFTRVPQDLSRQLAMPFVYDAIVRLRCGPGLQDALCYGSSGPSSSSNQLDQNFPCISSDLSFTFKIDYDGRLADSECAHFQLAVLHTTPHGVRRIRVLNLGLPSSKSHAQIFKFIDLEAILSYETKSMTYRMCLQSISSISNGLLARSSQIFAAYRKHCTSGTSSGQVSPTFQTDLSFSLFCPKPSNYGPFLCFP
jgi:protein transport protein SEC24